MIKMESTTGMASFIEAINTGFSADALWNVVSGLAPFMITVGLVALGYYLFRKLGKGAVKLKFRP